MMDIIDIYILNLCEFHSNLSIVDAAIKKNAAHYKLSKKRLEYIASEWLRRFVLKRYIGNQDLIFDITKKGRPFLKNRPDYDFNISHTENWIVIAVTKNQKIGIDIQSSTGSIDPMGIAKKYYAPIEYKWLSKLPKFKINNYFYWLWTLKEASVKRTGEGITSGLTHYAFIYRNKKLQLSDSVTIYRPYYYSRIVKPNILLSLAATNPIVKVKNFIIKNTSILNIDLCTSNEI